MASPPAPANNSTLRIEKFPHPRLQTIRVFNLALPNRQHFPSISRERVPLLLVPYLIPFEFRHPEIQARFRQASQHAARVPMPETTMYKDNLPQFSEN